MCASKSPYKSHCHLKIYLNIRCIMCHLQVNSELTVWSGELIVVMTDHMCFKCIQLRFAFGLFNFTKPNSHSPLFETGTIIYIFFKSFEEENFIIYFLLFREWHTLKCCEYNTTTRTHTHMYLASDGFILFSANAFDTIHTHTHTLIGLNCGNDNENDICVIKNEFEGSMKKKNIMITFKMKWKKKCFEFDTNIYDEGQK